jgi:hypothetical protein
MPPFVMSFEWHGWIRVVASPLADDDEVTDAAAVVVSSVQDYLDALEPVDNEVLEWRHHNGAMHVWMAGCHNHPSPEPFTLFEHIGRMAPGSYGVLHSLDHDQLGDSPDWTRRVLRRGEVHIEVEGTLSPHIGAVEDPEPEAAND